MLSAAHTVLISLRPDLHSDIFVGQSDLLFVYMGVSLGLLSMCNYVNPRPKNRCGELLLTKFSFYPIGKSCATKVPSRSNLCCVCLWHKYKSVLKKCVCCQFRKLSHKF